MIDLRKDAVILEMPEFDSKYVSLMVTAYDHYVNVPMTTRVGDLRSLKRFCSTPPGRKVTAANRWTASIGSFEATGDFISAIFRVMPHGNEPERFARIIEQMQSVKPLTLSEFRGGAAKPMVEAEFPAIGETDADVFGGNLLEVMQFVFNHVTFDPENEIDQRVLAAHEPLGVEPGRQYDPASVAEIDREQFRSVAEEIATRNLALMSQPEAAAALHPYWFQPKGETTLDALVATSVIGPIGLPAAEAEYPSISTTEGEPLNAMHDYVIRMTKDQLPPAEAFWSVTLYDLQNGFFIPNDRKKYSVGENAGMKLNEDGGIEIHIAAEQPDGVPEENWLPINRQDEDMDIVLRVYVADLEKMEAWTAPKAEKLAIGQKSRAKVTNELDEHRTAIGPAFSATSERNENQDEPHDETSHARRAGGCHLPRANLSRLCTGQAGVS